MSFDELLQKAAEECCKKEVEEFLNIDTTGFDVTPAEIEKFKKILNQEFNHN